MYQHHIHKMASSLMEAGLVQDRQAVEFVLSADWKNKIAVVWCIDDVQAIQDDFDPETEKSSLSDEQAQEILLSAFEHHDCNNGITWDSLHYWSKEILEQEIVSAPSWEEE